MGMICTTLLQTDEHDCFINSNKLKTELSICVRVFTTCCCYDIFICITIATKWYTLCLSIFQNKMETPVYHYSKTKTQQTEHVYYYGVKTSTSLFCIFLQLLQAIELICFIIDIELAVSP